ncbi:TonB-dependent receptor family protein [Changchengzhania lutea]|uniref:TonB-dependent receptor family protein n=1 Tax=Changchengzhania lutea TaxID=2049305 RepID=UPI001FE5FDD6|nr:TonB-dependent receptor [Changchengzhania lutea]
MQIFKINYLTSITLLLTLFSYGQTNITGKVIDSENTSNLSLVKIISTDTNDTVVSNRNGYFEVSKKGIYLINKKGYLNRVIQLGNTSYAIIELDMNPSELNEVIISTNHNPEKLKQATASISIISSKDIKLGNNVDMAPILNRASGIFMHSGALNTNRITIRGIGSRNQFGTSKIRAYFKDIPLTNGSGETNIEDFELASIARFEILKGATSSIYGAGLGGVINIIPQNAYLNKSSLNNELSIGSFGLMKGLININHGTTNKSFRTTYSHTQSDGYRENNKYNRKTFTLHANHFLSQKDELSFLASYVDLKAFIPSSIDKITYLNTPKSAAFTWKASQGYEDSKHGIFGLSWNHEFNSQIKQVTSLFTSFRKNYEPRPFNILKENTWAIGIRSRILGHSKLFGKTMNWTLGAELFRDTYTSKTFENLYEDAPAGTGSIRGNPLSSFKEKRNYFNTFSEVNYELFQKTTVSIGLNFNITAYELDDRFTISESNPDQSGGFKFNGITSPKLGVSHLLSENISLYSSISHGFSPISLNEILLPDGQVNNNLKPETGWNYEIGARSTTRDNRLQFNVAIYRLDIKNLLVSKRTAEDEFIGINAGRTQHDGLELGLRYKWIQNKALSINSFLNYTRNDYIFKVFIDGSDDFSGNDLTGVPSYVFNAGIDLNSKMGIYGNINFQSVGSMPITDSNTLYSDSYQLTNIKFGYRATLNKNISFNIFVGLNNLFNTTYASQILINASGFGGRVPRYYYPGNPTNYYTGINLNYIF